MELHPNDRRLIKLIAESEDGSISVHTLNNNGRFFDGHEAYEILLGIDENRALAKAKEELRQIAVEPYKIRILLVHSNGLYFEGTENQRPGDFVGAFDASEAFT